MNNYFTHTSLSGLCMRFGSIGLALFSFSGHSFAGSTNLAWDASTSPNVGGYIVSYGQSSGHYDSSIDVGNKNTLTVSGLQEGTQYFFGVKAYDSARSTESGYSNEVSMTVPVTTTTGGTDNENEDGTGGGTDGRTDGGTGVGTGGTTESPGGSTGENAGTDSGNDGLVAAYGFEETNGKTVVDASGNGNHGTIKEAVRIFSGRYGKALKFDGVNDWVTIENSASLALSTGMTLEAWVYPQSLTIGGKTVFFKEIAGGSDDYSLYANEDANLPVSYINNGDYRIISGPNQLPANQWTHLVATYDGQYQRLYVNGAEVAQQEQKGLIRQSGGVLRIGGNSIWGEYFKGYIDEMRIYNRALTATEINSNKTTAISVSNPPQFVMGDRNEEPWVENRPQGVAQAYQTVPEKAGMVTDVQVYLDASTTATQLAAGIYSDNNGHPGKLIGRGTLKTLKPDAWNSVSIASASVTANQPYWIAILGLNGEIGFLNQVGSGTGVIEQSSGRSLRDLPGTWTGSGDGYKANASMSVYGNGY